MEEYPRAPGNEPPSGEGDTFLYWEVTLAESAPPPVEEGAIRERPDERPGPIEVLVSLQPGDVREPATLIPFPSSPAIRRRRFIQSLFESAPGDDNPQAETMRVQILLWLMLRPWEPWRKE